jgi:hypothetical protein
MKFYTSIFLIALLGYTVCLFATPWWSFTITTFVVCASIPQQPLKAFFSGFIALFLLWGIMAFLQDNANEHLLSSKVAQILKLPKSYVLLIGITALIGSILGGLSALSGCLVRQLFHKND